VNKEADMGIPSSHQIVGVFEVSAKMVYYFDRQINTQDPLDVDGVRAESMESS